jgi:molecular chaperone GrpE
LSDEERRIEIEGKDEEDTLEETPEEPEEEEETEEDEDSPEAMAEALAKADEEAAQGAPEWEIPEEELGNMDLSQFEQEEKAQGPSAEELKELNDKYVRLYAEFENYKKKAAKDKEELATFVKEEVIYELLPSLDHLDIALKHANEDESLGGLKQGVEMTLRELYRTLEKFGLRIIEAEGKPFNPEYHHAMSQVETEEFEDKTVIEEFRKGYMFGDKVLRAAMVSVSRKPGEEAEKDQGETEEEIENEDTNDTKED